MNSNPNNLEQRIAQIEQTILENSLPDYAIVGSSYVARLFDCSEESVVRGRFGIDRIPRCREKPVGFRKRDVHRVLKELSKPIAERAAEERMRAKLLTRKPRKKSIIRKKNEAIL